MLDCVRSKLASLFGMDQASQQTGNESLTYTAPKEPKKSKFWLMFIKCFLFCVLLHFFCHSSFYFSLYDVFIITGNVFAVSVSSMSIC